MISQAKPPAVINIGRYNIQTMAAAITVSTAATTCASFHWPVWAMLLGWVASLTAGRSLKDVFRSYVCLAAGIALTIIVSMREMPYANHVPSYLLGVCSVSALHPKPIGFALFEFAFVTIAAPSAVGVIGAWLAYLCQAKISDYYERVCHDPLC
jgi:hypothetical protein